MKKLIALLIVVFANVSIYAVNENPVKKEIREKIITLLGKTEFPVAQEITANIDFIVNPKGELVILNVKNASILVTDYVKSRLNYKKVTIGTSKISEVYTMPLRIKAN